MLMVIYHLYEPIDRWRSDSQSAIFGVHKDLDTSIRGFTATGAYITAHAWRQLSEDPVNRESVLRSIRACLVTNGGHIVVENRFRIEFAVGHSFMSHMLLAFRELFGERFDITLEELVSCGLPFVPIAFDEVNAVLTIDHPFAFKRQQQQ